MRRRDSRQCHLFGRRPRRVVRSRRGRELSLVLAVACIAGFLLVGAIEAMRRWAPRGVVATARDAVHDEVRRMPPIRVTEVN